METKRKESFRFTGRTIAACMIAAMVLSPMGVVPAAASSNLTTAVEVDAVESAATAGTVAAFAGESFSLIVTLRDTSPDHSPVSGVAAADFNVAAFDSGTSNTAAGKLEKKAVIETFPGVYTLTAQQSTPHPGMDIEVTVKGTKLTAKVKGMLVAPSRSPSTCPSDTALRHYDIVALQTDTMQTAYVLQKDASKVESGEMRPDALILRVARGECLEVNLNNRLRTTTSVRVGKMADNGAGVTVQPGGTASYRYFGYREGTLGIREVNGGSQDAPQTLPGVVIVEPEGSRFVDPQTGQLGPAGQQAIIQGPALNDDFRELASVFQEQGSDLEVNEEEMVYQTLVNYPIATQKKRKAALGLGSYDSTMGTPPMGTMRSYVGDPVRIRVANANIDRVVSFGLDDHQWPAWTAGGAAGNTRMVSDKIVAPLETMDAVLSGGAGGNYQQTGTFLWGNSRLPYIQEDEWGLLEVWSEPDASLRPLSDRVLTRIVPTSEAPQQEQPFLLAISGATAEDGAYLNGPVQAKVTSSNVSEGTGGIVFDHDLLFINGKAEIPLRLEKEGGQELTVELNGVKADSTIAVSVIPADSSTAQAKASVSSPLTGQPFMLEITGAKGPDGGDLSGAVPVSVASDNQSEGANGVIFDAAADFTGGKAGIPLHLDNAGAHTLTLNIAGITTPVTLNLNVLAEQAQTDHSEAAVSPSTASPVVNQAFQLQITGAKGADGSVLKDEVSVRITSSMETDGRVVFEQPAAFTDGNANIALSLAQSGQQTLTVQIAGVTDSRIAPVSLIVQPPKDYSSAAVTPSTTWPVQNQTFSLNITEAKNASGAELSGSIALRATSSDNREGVGGVLFDSTASFGGGAATVPVILTQTGEQTITLQITGVTAATNAVVTVKAPEPPKDLSGATVTPSTAKPVEKTRFNLQISGAKGFNGAALAGQVVVTVTSSDVGEGLKGVVFNSAAAFTNGNSNVPIVLERKGKQTLKVVIKGITAPISVPIEVVQQR